ncbi:MAG: hypothetical protein ACYSUB_23155 [Planctomycetota bacterium]|jgi:hypothetical protein
MLTAESLRKRIDWPAVDEEVNCGWVYLYIRPTDPSLEPIYFCMGEDRSFIQQSGFGKWHYHPDDIEEAVETAVALIRREKCVLEERDGSGKYLGGGLHRPSGLPDTLGQTAAYLRRVFFDREPVDEAIHFAPYFRGRHIWISREHKEEVEQVFREAGLEPPEW